MISGVSTPAENPDAVTVTVKDIKYLVQDGNSFAYLITSRDEIYKIDCAAFETVVLTEPGDRVRLSAVEEETGVNTVLTFELL